MTPPVTECISLIPAANTCRAWGHALRPILTPRNFKLSQRDQRAVRLYGCVQHCARFCNIRVLGWVGDETPWQVAIALTATKSADQRSDTVARFLRADRKGVRDYHDAFVGPGETPQLGPTADAVWAGIAKYTGNTIEELKLGIPDIDPDARLDVKDIMHQIAWYKSQGIVKPEVDGDQVIDKRYVIPMSER